MPAWLDNITHKLEGVGSQFSDTVSELKGGDYKQLIPLGGGMAGAAAGWMLGSQLLAKPLSKIPLIGDILGTIIAPLGGIAGALLGFAGLAAVSDYVKSKPVMSDEEARNKIRGEDKNWGNRSRVTKDDIKVPTVNDQELDTASKDLGERARVAYSKRKDMLNKVAIRKTLDKGQIDAILTDEKNAMDHVVELQVMAQDLKKFNEGDRKKLTDAFTNKGFLNDKDVDKFVAKTASHESLTALECPDNRLEEFGKLTFTPDKWNKWNVAQRATALKDHVGKIKLDFTEQGSKQYMQYKYNKGSHTAWVPVPVHGSDRAFNLINSKIGPIIAAGNYTDAECDTIISAMKGTLPGLDASDFNKLKTFKGVTLGVANYADDGHGPNQPVMDKFIAAAEAIKICNAYDRWHQGTFIPHAKKIGEYAIKELKPHNQRVEDMAQRMDIFQETGILLGNNIRKADDAKDASYTHQLDIKDARLYDPDKRSETPPPATKTLVGNLSTDGKKLTVHKVVLWEDRGGAMTRVREITLDAPIVIDAEGKEGRLNAITDILKAEDAKRKGPSTASKDKEPVRDAVAFLQDASLNDNLTQSGLPAKPKEQQKNPLIQSNNNSMNT